MIFHIDGMTNDSSVGHANKFDSFGAEFRRLRFSIKVV